MNKRFLIFALIIAVTCLSIGVYFGNKKFQVDSVKDESVKQFLALTLKDSQNKPQAINQWKNKFLVVNFWATWCKPCVQEMPELVELQKEFSAQNVQFLGLGIDSPTNIAEFAEKYQISYPLFAAGMEGTELSRAMGNKAGGLPFTVLISTDGRVVKSYLGRLKMDELRSDIKKFTDNS
jgi:thiol-disulfide isomerase/thioredoxin